MLNIDAAIAGAEDLSMVPPLVNKAYGVVLDLGPSNGAQLGRFNSNNVAAIYGVEPNQAFLLSLHDSVQRHELGEKYTVVPCRVEDTMTMREYGIVEGSIDTIVSVHVLCSVKDPSKVEACLDRYLKPGGQLIFYEHIRHHTLMPRLLQGGATEALLCWKRI